MYCLYIKVWLCEKSQIQSNDNCSENDQYNDLSNDETSEDQSNYSNNENQIYSLFSNNNTFPENIINSP